MYVMLGIWSEYLNSILMNKFVDHWIEVMRTIESMLIISL